MSELAISERAETGMITIRADLKDKAICDADELLLVLPRLQVGEALLRLGTSLRGLHHLATDVSEARAVFDISSVSAFVKDWLETVSRRGEEVGFF